MATGNHISKTAKVENGATLKDTKVLELARVRRTAKISDSIIKDAAIVQGEVINSVVSGWSDVDKNVTVEDSSLKGEVMLACGVVVKSSTLTDCRFVGASALYGVRVTEAIMLGVVEVHPRKNPTSPEVLKPTGTDHQHPNGGGWVAGTATVEDTCYIGPEARVEGKAVVKGRSQLKGKVIVDGQAVITNSKIHDSVRVGFLAKVTDSILTGKLRVSGNADLRSVCMRGNCDISGGKWYGDIRFR